MKSKSSKKTAKTGPQDATKKVFDVMRPGKTPVSPTSRPVIVGHKPQVKDPMMSDRDERPLMDSNKKVTVQPAADASAPLPPTNADPADLALASHQSETVAASQSGPDRSEAAPATPDVMREPTRSSEALATQPAESELVGGSTGAAPVSDRTRTPEAGAVHAAPPLSDDDKPAEAPKQDDMPAQMPYLNDTDHRPRKAYFRELSQLEPSATDHPEYAQLIRQHSAAHQPKR